MMDVNDYQEYDKELSKKFGDSYIGPSQQRVFDPVVFIPAGTICINRILNGGLPEGRLIEMYGPFSSGKSSVAADLTAGMQRLGKPCLWIDAEMAFEPEYAALCGVDNSLLAKFEPLTANNAIEAVRYTLTKGLIKFIVLDSVAALVPGEDYEKDVGVSQVGAQARLLSQSLKQIANLASRSGCTILFLNQERASNLMGYGPKTTTSGGNALSYYTSVRIRLTRTGDKEKNGEKVGISVKAETTKNKTGAPSKRAEFDILFPYEHNGVIYAGVDVIKDVLDCAMEFDIVIKKGAWLNYGEVKIQGEDNFRGYLQDNELVFEEIQDKVRTKFRENKIVC